MATANKLCTMTQLSEGFCFAVMLLTSPASTPTAKHGAIPAAVMGRTSRIVCLCQSRSPSWVQPHSIQVGRATCRTQKTLTLRMPAKVCVRVSCNKTWSIHSQQSVVAVTPSSDQPASPTYDLPHTRCSLPIFFGKLPDTFHCCFQCCFASSVCLCRRFFRR
jgi:hypothetical protein